MFREMASHQVTEPSMTLTDDEGHSNWWDRYVRFIKFDLEISQVKVEEF